MKLITSISGIRGIYGKTLTDTIASNYVHSFSNIQSSGKILLAQDSRPHGKNIYDHACKALVALGREVISCGIIPTPTAQFIIKEQKLAGGIVITASHNPIEWNGLKFLDNDGCFLNADKMEKLLSEHPKSITADKTGHVIEFKNAYQNHIKNILNLNCIDINTIKSKNFKVVVDTVNGAAYKALPDLLEELNCNVIKIHCDNDGAFPRGTEPIPCHLEDLSKAVTEHNADIGFATDPDADRLAIVDNHGNPIGEESTLVLALESYLKYYQDSQKVVTNLSTSMAVDVIAAQYNSTVQRSSVGEINVVEKMKELNSPLSGEMSGHVCYGDDFYGYDDAMYVALRLLRILANQNKFLSALIDIYPKTFSTPETRFDVDESRKFIIIDEVKERLKGADEKIIDIDGVRVESEDGWFLMRASNTQNQLTCRAESISKEGLQNLINTIEYQLSLSGVNYKFMI